MAFSAWYLRSDAIVLTPTPGIVRHDLHEAASRASKGVCVSLEEIQPERQGSLIRKLKEFMGLQRRPKEIQEVLDESEEQGLIDHNEGDMIEGIFDLKQTVAREIMIPRTYIVGIPRDSIKDQILKAIIESGHSRLPVYDENIDHIVGILNAKDLLPLWLDGDSEFDIEPILREPFFVPETKRINDLLNDLRTKKSHLAVIVDEYGGTAGIVTIEDIIEEIIGDIRDEHDTEEELFIPQEDGSELVNAWANLDDFEERFDVKLPREGYDTLGGFIIHLLGRVPRKGEVIDYEGLRLKIQVGDQKRITRVSVSRLGAEPSPGIPSNQPETNP
jgi:magnesium and cobalt transporter